jgi:hypothetical protein
MRCALAMRKLPKALRNLWTLFVNFKMFLSLAVEMQICPSA